MKTLTQDSADVLARAVQAVEALDRTVDRLRAERAALGASYCDLLARHRALLTGRSGAAERAAIDDQAAIASALAAGARRVDRAA